MINQLIVFTVLLLSLILFIQGRWRYDLVALMALLAVTVTGLITGEQAFLSFGHPAVVTVAAVLVVSRGLQNAGVVEVIAKWLSRVGNRATLQVASLSGLVAVFSGFMNNVGALALLMPVGLRMARTGKNSPSILMMPLAFGSLLGGLITLIGTPPNIIIATFRAQNGGEPFRMFDFAPVGLGVALAGLIFIALIGWRLTPQRKAHGSREELFEVKDYLIEVVVPEKSKMVGKFLRDLENSTEADIMVLGLVRADLNVSAPSNYETIKSGDVLVIQGDSEDIKTLLDAAELEVAGDKKPGEEVLDFEDTSLLEAIVTMDSPMLNRTAASLNLRWFYGVNLLAVARRGLRLKERLKNIRFQPGDIILLQGKTDSLQEAVKALRCLPLAERGLKIGEPRRILFSLAIFGIALITAAFGFLPIQVTFVSAAVAMIVTNLITLREAYESISWPIIILLGAMIPVGQALESTGGAQTLANLLLTLSSQMPPIITLTIVLVGTMLLSNVINNAAAAVLMAPIAVNISEGLYASANPFLMAVAVGASCAFLTPIGHQSNTLVMGPGGYKFKDYWRLGLPLSIIVIAVSIPLILHFWPL